METAELKKAVEGIARDALLQCVNFGKSGEGCAWVESSRLPKICSALCESPDLEFDWLENLSAMQMDEVIVFTYFLRSRENDQTAILRSSVEMAAPEERVSFPSVVGIWPSAALQEAEISSMYGVSFLLGEDPAPGPKRGILPESIRGFPLRKTFALDSEITTPDAGGIE